MYVRLRMQLAEALGPDNRWFCSQAFGRPIDDAETLLVYFIKSGGARDFAERYAEAMASPNRWYCSEHFGREIHDEETLWKYYCRSCERVLTRKRSHGRATSEQFDAVLA